MKFLTFALCCGIGAATLAADAQPGTALDLKFDRLAASYIDESPGLSPVSATTLGDHRFDSLLDDVSDVGRQREREFCQRYLKELDQIAPARLSRDRQVDYQLLSQQLQSQLWRLDELQEWAWNPIDYTQLTGGAIYGLMAREFAPVEQRLISVADRLEQFPRLYAQIRATLDPKRVPPIHAETALKQNRGVLSIIDNMVRPHLDRLIQADRERLAKLIDSATAAVEEHQKWMERELVPNAKGDAKLGAQRFDTKLRYALGTNLSRQDIRERAEFEMRRVRTEMYGIARRYQLKLHPAAQLPESPSDDVQQKVIEFALEKAYADVPPRDGVVPAARTSLDISTKFVREHDLITIPDDPLEIIVMPEFQRGVSVAYCDSPGPLEVGLKTFYAVAPLPADWSDAQCNSFLREYNTRSIHNLTVHEAMPGHFVQIAHANRSRDRLRSLLSSGTFVEGWACYTEQMVSEEGFMADDPLMRLVTLKWYLRTIANAILDQSVHVDGIRREEAMHLMMHDTFQEEREAAGKWIRAQVTSAQLSTYFVGLQEHMDLRTAARAKWGNAFQWKRYHDGVVSFGSPPVKYVKALLLDEPIPDIKVAAAEPVPGAQWTPELMMQAKRVGTVQVSPDGTLAAFTVREAIMDRDTSELRTQIHLAQTDGSRTWQLTQGNKSSDDPQWSPDGQTLAFISTRTGRKNLWLIPAHGGEAAQLTHCRSDVTSFRWSPDGTSIAYSALDPVSDQDERRMREKNDARVADEEVRYNRLFIVKTDQLGSPTEPQQVIGGHVSLLPDGVRSGRTAFDWSPDGKSIVIAHNQSPAANDWVSANISLVAIETGLLTPLCQTAAAESSPLFSPNGQWIAYTASDTPPHWGGQKRVHVIPVTGGTPIPLAETPDALGRYAELIGWSANGKGVYVTETAGTSLQVLWLAVPSADKTAFRQSPTAVYRPQGMSMSGVSLNSTRTWFGFGWEQSSRPCEAFVTPVATIAPRQISQIHHDLPSLPIGRTEVIRWKSTDDFEVEGLLTYPVNYEQGSRYPVLVVIHGGPMGVFTQTFDAAPTQYPIAAFSARGYIVLRPNPRGSSGYGARFRYANYGDWGGGDYRDIMAGIDHLDGIGVADIDRMGVMGWSYGGYMTAWIITQTSQFKAASVGAGVTNLMSFNGTADIPGFVPDYMGGEFWDRFDEYRQHSPMFHVKGVTTPTLIQHGERDERVPVSQGQELYNALKRQGCDTKMVIYPRTPHSIEEPRLLLDCMQRNLDWFNHHLLASGSRTGSTSAAR